jgi:tryptophanase
VPVVQPAGCHAVYVRAGEILPHIPAHRFPGHAWSCALFVAETAIEVGRMADDLTGYRIVGESPALRHFTAVLEPLSAPDGVQPAA